MKILNLGSCNIDNVYTLDHIAGVGETENADTLEFFPGGRGLNQIFASTSRGTARQAAFSISSLRMASAFQKYLTFI